jgi:glycosyltransferase involved in cell wall biosynthesis
MSHPKFSIIIPTYNRVDFIEKTIKSVLTQTFTDFEIIVVDDGSTDNTEEVVLSITDERVKYYKKDNEERAVARNFGAKKAIGEYITFLDSDDLFYENHLAEANKFIQKGDINVLFQAYEIVSGNTLKKMTFPNQNINKLLITEGNIISCHGIFLKRDIALQNLFNEDINLTASEDYELWLRIASKYKIVHNPITTSCLIDHEGRSVTNINKEKLIKRKMLFLKYTLENIEVSKFIGKNKNIFISNAYSYIALHLILAKYKREGLNFYLQSVKQYPLSIFSRRSLAIIKHLIT